MAATPYSHGMSYSRANGVATAHAVVVWAEGKDPNASSVVNQVNSLFPRPVFGRARPKTIFRPVAATAPVVPASRADQPVRERTGSLPSIAANPASPMPMNGSASPTLIVLSSHELLACSCAQRNARLSSELPLKKSPTPSAPALSQSTFLV